MLCGQDIICFSTSFWGFREGSRENIAKYFSLKNRVLYIDYQLNPLQLLIYPHARNFFLKKPCLEKVNDRFFVLHPRLGLPFGTYCAVINSLNQFFLLRQIKRALRKLKFNSYPILWIYNPLHFPLMRNLKKQLSVYHCIDNFASEKSSRMRQDFFTKMERSLCRCVDLVFAQNEVLIDKLSAHAKKIFLLEPGLKDAFLADAARIRVQHGKKVTIGFVGSIDRRIDHQILESIAKNHPQWQLTLVGPVMGGFRHINRLRRLKNIRLAGLKQKELAGIYSEFQIGIIPYHINQFTNGIFPLKLFEYFSFGIPVISTALDAVKEFAKDNLVYIENREGFSERIEHILNAGEDPALRKKRFHIASGNLWSKKFSYIERVLSESLKDKNVKTV